jgi:replicative DNA helicase
MTALAERVLPQNLEAERAILGAILLDNSRLSDACEHLEASRFFRAGHRRIFDQMVALGERQEAIDFLTLRDALTKAGTLEDAGGPAYLSALVDGVPRGANVGAYAKLVAEAAALRDLITAGNQLVATAYQADDDAASVLEQAEQTILGLADRRAAGGFEAMRDIAPRALDFLERMHQTRGGVSGVPSGFTDLDHLTRGFQPGTLIVSGQDLAPGKTSLALNIAVNAGRAEKRVGFFSLEMPNEELFIRQIAALAGIDSHRLQTRVRE